MSKLDLRRLLGGETARHHHMLPRLCRRELIEIVSVQPRQKLTDSSLIQVLGKIFDPGLESGVKHGMENLIRDTADLQFGFACFILSNSGPNAEQNALSATIRLRDKQASGW